jgi:hypothetical protein
LSTNPPSERIASLLAEATPRAAAELQELAETTPEKEIRKSARRALYQLGQRHITPASAPIQLASRAENSPRRSGLRAFVSAYDGDGHRAIYFFYPDSDGGSPTFVQFLTREETGIKDFGAQRMSRRQVADTILNMEMQLAGGIAFAEIESDYAFYLLHRAYAAHLRQKTQSPPGTLDWLSRLGIPEQDYPTAPIYARLSAAEVLAAPDVSHEPNDLFTLPWFDPWFLDIEQVEPWLALLMTGIQTEETEEQKRERAEQTTGEVVDAVMDCATRARYVHQLEQSADVLLRRDQDQAGRAALLHAVELASDRPASQILFARRLVERTIMVALSMRMQDSEEIEDDENGDEDGE